jgi:hypothetical protein
MSTHVISDFIFYKMQLQRKQRFYSPKEKYPKKLKLKLKYIQKIICSSLHIGSSSSNSN